MRMALFRVFTLLLLATLLTVGGEANSVQEPLSAHSLAEFKNLLIRIRTAGSQKEPVASADYDALIWQIRQIGLKRDCRRWKLLLDALHPEVLDAVGSVSGTKRGRFHLQAAVLTALARAGCWDAIEPLQQASSYLDPYFRREVLPVVIARLHTKRQFSTPDNLAEWNEAVSVFMSKVGLSLREAVADLDAYSQRKPTLPPDTLIEAPRGVVALRMLAEMASEAYANGVPDAFRPFEKWTDDLRGKDYILWMHIQTGKRTTAERIVCLINHLLEDGVQTLEDRCVQQAIVDCGEQAVPALTAKIEALERGEHPSSAYPLHMALLLETLSAFDSLQATQTLERLKNHPESGISEAASVYLARKQRGERPTFVCWL